MLVANLRGLSDGLAYRQANGGEGAASFLYVVEELNPELLLRAVRGVDLGLAQVYWPTRLTGSPEERDLIRRILEVAERAGGQIGELAAAVQARGTA